MPRPARTYSLAMVSYYHNGLAEWDTLKTVLSAKHCFKSISFSQAIRVKRICSTVETTKQRLGDLRHHLKKRVSSNDDVNLLVFAGLFNKGNNKITELRTILQRESQNS